MVTRTLILIATAMLSLLGCRTSSVTGPQAATPVVAESAPSGSTVLAQHTPSPKPTSTEKIEDLEITPSGIPGLFASSDLFSTVRESLGLEEQPLWIIPKGGGPRLNTRAQHSDKYQIMLKLRSETRALLVSLNPNYRMADGRGVGNEVGDFLSDFKMLNSGFVESIDLLKDKPGMYAVYWLVPRDSIDTESRFGLVLDRNLEPSAFAQEYDIKKWSEADEDTLRSEKVLGFSYRLDVKI